MQCENIILILERFLNSTFLQTVVTAVAVYCAYLIGKKQNQINEELRAIQDLVELYACPGVKDMKRPGDQGIELVTYEIRPIVVLQNVGTRLVYLNEYIFNGSKYILDSHVLPSTYSQADAKFWIELPTNGVQEVNIEIFFTDASARKWKSQVYANIKDGTWLVKNLKCVTL